MLHCVRHFVMFLTSAVFLTGFSTWVLGELQMLRWNSKEQAPGVQGCATFRKVRWTNPDGLPFAVKEVGGHLASIFTVQLPREGSGVWLHAAGPPMLYCVDTVSGDRQMFDVHVSSLKIC